MRFKSAGYSDCGWDVFGLVAEQPTFPDRNSVTQKVYRLSLPEAILDGHIEWLGEGFCVQYPEQQFKPMQYPEPGPGGAEIKMIHRHGGSFISTMSDTSKWVRMYQIAQAGVRGHAGLPLAERDQVRRRDPAGLHQLRAPGHLRVGAAGRLRQRQRQLQPPHPDVPAEVHRAAVGVQARLPDLLRAGRAPGLPGGVHRGQLRRGLDQEGLRHHRPAQAHQLRGLQEEGLLRGAVGARRLQAHDLQPVVLRGTPGRHARQVQPAGRHRARHRDGDP